MADWVKVRDAEKMWCPYARVLVYGQANTSANRGMGRVDTATALCIHGACMKWERSDTRDGVGRCSA